MDLLILSGFRKVFDLKKQNKLEKNTQVFKIVMFCFLNNGDWGGKGEEGEEMKMEFLERIMGILRL